MLRKKKPIDAVQNTEVLSFWKPYKFVTIPLSREEGIVKKIITALSVAVPTSKFVKHKYANKGEIIIFATVPITDTFSIGDVLPLSIDPPAIINTKGKMMDIIISAVLSTNI